MGVPAPVPRPAFCAPYLVRARGSPVALRWATAGTPGALLEVVLACIDARPGEGRSGWSNVRHLRWDLEKVTATRFEPAAILSAVRRLTARGLVQTWCTDGGEIWVASTRVPTAPQPSHTSGRGSRAAGTARRRA